MYVCHAHAKEGGGREGKIRLGRPAACAHFRTRMRIHGKIRLAHETSTSCIATDFLTHSTLFPVS